MGHRMAGMAAFMLAIGAAGVSAQQMDMSKKMDMSKMTSADMMKMMTGWPKASRDAAEFMTKKYGPPAAMSEDQIIWGKTGPWKRTAIYRVEVPHEFPAHHTDVMQQWIDYKVPTDMFHELADYDGSVVVERTSGEMSARCDLEAANFLALNLADEIVRGKRSVSQARKMYGEQIMKMKAMQPAPYTEKLMFSAMMKTNDPDKPLMK